MDIGGSKLKSAESKVNHVSLQIDQVTGLVTKANVNKKTAKRYNTLSIKCYSVFYQFCCMHLELYIKKCISYKDLYLLFLTY